VCNPRRKRITWLHGARFFVELYGRCASLKFNVALGRYLDCSITFCATRGTQISGILFGIIRFELGRTGLTAVGNSHQGAKAMYDRAVAVLDEETRGICSVEALTFRRAWPLTGRLQAGVYGIRMRDFRAGRGISGCILSRIPSHMICELFRCVRRMLCAPRGGRRKIRRKALTFPCPPD